MEKKPTPGNGESKTQEWIAAAFERSPALPSLERAIAVLAALDLQNPRTKLEQDAHDVVLCAVFALRRPSGPFARRLSAMADLAGGAAKPGETFNSDLIGVIKMTRDVITAPAEKLSPAERWMLMRGVYPFAAKLVDGLERDDAHELLRRTFARVKTPAGVVVDLLHAAMQRGARFTTTLSKRSKRPDVAKVINEAQRREKKRSTRG